jgi:hypothetical protein
MLASIDAGLLVKVVWVSLLAGVVVCALFAFVVLFSARSAESRRSGAGGASMAYAALALGAMTVFALVVGYGVHVMLSKG